MTRADRIGWVLVPTVMVTGVVGLFFPAVRVAFFVALVVVGIIGKAVERKTTETCPHCRGNGRVRKEVA